MTLLLVECSMNLKTSLHHEGCQHLWIWSVDFEGVFSSIPFEGTKPRLRGCSSNQELKAQPVALNRPVDCWWSDESGDSNLSEGLARDVLEHLDKE